MYEKKENTEIIENESDVHLSKYLIFKIDEKEYAIDVLTVQEIVGIKNITYVPGSSPFMIGLINLRGNILHIIDIRLRFTNEEIEQKKDFLDNVIIVLSTGERKFGILADMVIDVISIKKDQITETPIDNTSGFGISHVIKLENRVVMVLPVDKVIM